MELSTEALDIMLWLAPGFLAFRVYKIDADWQSIQQIDVVYGSLIFSVLGYGALYPFRGLIASHGATWLILASLPSAIPIALIWRMVGHPVFHRFMQAIGTTNEDNRGDVWQRIFNEPQIYVTQIFAYMKNGEGIGCNDTSVYDTQARRKKGVYPYYTHKDKQICFVPNRRLVDGKWTDIEEVELDSRWGIRMVYVSPDELQRLEVRIAPIVAENRWKTLWTRFTLWAGSRRPEKLAAEAEELSRSEV